MKELYRLDVLSVSDKYIIPVFNGSINNLKSFFFRDEIWHIDKGREVISISENGGINIPDIISCEDMILISNKLKKFLIKEGIDYIFYKEVLISDEVIGLEEIFWLVSIPRIDCIDFERSIIEDKDEYDYKDGIVPFYNITQPVIVPENCGRYEIFRILGATSNTIYVFDRLYERLKSEKFIGIGFRKIM